MSIRLENVELTRDTRTIDLSPSAKNLPNPPPSPFSSFSFVVLSRRARRRLRRGRGESNDRFSSETFENDLVEAEGRLPLSHQRKGWWTLHGYFRSPPLSRATERKGWRPRSWHARFKCINNERPVSGTRDSIGSGARRIFSPPRAPKRLIDTNCFAGAISLLVKHRFSRRHTLSN